MPPTKREQHIHAIGLVEHPAAGGQRNAVCGREYRIERLADRSPTAIQT